jgi:hypothetical protein
MSLKRLIPGLAPLALTAALTLVPASAQAQAPAPEGEASTTGEGRVFDGYFVAGIFAFAALFAVAKTARRG